MSNVRSTARFIAAPAPSRDRKAIRMRSPFEEGVLFALCTMALLPQASLGQSDTAKVASPDKVISVQIGVDAERRPYYSVDRNGRPLISASRLGFLFTDGLRWERNIAIASKAE
ncbi:MAG TPA: glycoside hydrolase family 97 N-terminal domain-containing protein, partial [Steroidobacteraceae bacterium]|nr:glycoside hydrolase family 97 N-terminal domain-containing protein [Steroidobacteraceae bacterium]